MSASPVLVTWMDTVISLGSASLLLLSSMDTFRLSTSASAAAVEASPATSARIITRHTINLRFIAHLGSATAARPPSASRAGAPGRMMDIDLLSYCTRELCFLSSYGAVEL